LFAPKNTATGGGCPKVPETHTSCAFYAASEFLPLFFAFALRARAEAAILARAAALITRLRFGEFDDAKGGPGLRRFERRCGSRRVCDRGSAAST
jgi:hypothetical protein